MANEIKEHGSVQLMDVPCFLAKYEDGLTGKMAVRIGFVVGGEVRFLKEDVLSKPAQKWLQEDIMVALGMKAEETNTPANLEQQL